jgi:putative transposase
MRSLRILRPLKNQVYFVTFTIRNWYYFFDRHDRFRILEDSFAYCQKNKGLKIYAFVFMLNHLHFVGSAPDLIAVIRDMKTFLSKEFKRNILATEPNILRLFEKNGEYQFWQDHNCPEIVETDWFLEQKVNYIHFNPVRKQYVHDPADWRWSSACKIPTRIQISTL